MVLPLVAYLYQTPAAAQLLGAAGNQSALVWLQLRCLHPSLLLVPCLSIL